MPSRSVLTVRALARTSHFVRRIIFLFLLVTCYLLLVTPVHAQESSSSATPGATSSAATIPQTLYPIPSHVSPTSPVYTDLLVHNMFHTFSCLAVGGSIIGQPCLSYQLQKNAQGAIQSVPVLSQTNLSGGALGVATSIVIGMYQNPPVKTIDYLAVVRQDFGIIKEAHAQVGGTGNIVLSPVIALWQVSRNVSYVTMILIFVVIGLMIMFRQRINPQTVITAQAALPGLVIGLILITFSYFIASFMTDFAFIGTDLVGYYFQTAQKITPTSLTQSLEQENVLSIMSPFAGAIARGDIQHALDVVWDQIRDKGFSAEGIIRGFTALAAYQFGASVGPVLGQAVAGIACLAVVPFGGPFAVIGIATVPLCAQMGGVIGTYGLPTILGVIGASNPPFIIAFVVSFVIIFIILYSMGKLLLRLINCYLTIVFLTITGPFHLLVSALPGRQGIAVDWMRNLLCNTLSFPAVAAVIYFAGYLLGGPDSHLPGIQSQLSITNASTTLPLFGGMDLSFLRILLAFAALTALPSIPDIVCRVIGKPGAAGDLFGRELQGNISAGRGYQGQFGQRVGAVGTDMSQYRKKWYRDPYEKEGLGARIGQLSGSLGTEGGPVKKVFGTLKGGLTAIKRGKPAQQANTPTNDPNADRQI